VELGRPPPAQIAFLLGRGRARSRGCLPARKLCPHEARSSAAPTHPSRAWRISALQALGLASPLAHRTLLLQPGHERAAVAVEVARALGRERGADAAAALTAILSHPAPAVRREAAAAIGTAGFATARPALVRITGDPDPAVAAAAARSLWLLRQRPTPQPFATGEAA
jgi:HEAT repeat protein